MRLIKNFLHNINDIVLAIIIVAIAAAVIYWRMQIILDYPKQLADEQAVYLQEDTDNAAEAAGAEEADSEKSEASEEEKTDGSSDSEEQQSDDSKQ